MKKIDTKKLQEQVIQVATLFIGQPEIKLTDRYIIESALNLWQTTVFNSGIFTLDTKFLALGILKTKDLKVRETFRDTFKQICNKYPTQCIPLLENAIDQLDGLKECSSAREFFGLQKKLVQIYM